MLRATADMLNLASRTRSVVEQRYPGEHVLFTTAVTILETQQETSIGWSLRRFGQRRGNVTVTDKRIFIQSSLFSPLTILWFAIIGLLAYSFLQVGGFFKIILALTAAAFIFQRRPYSVELPFEAIRRIEFGSVRSLGRGDIISIVIDGRAVQLVTSQVIPPELRERLLSAEIGGPKH